MTMNNDLNSTDRYTKIEHVNEIEIVRSNVDQSTTTSAVL